MSNALITHVMIAHQCGRSSSQSHYYHTVQARLKDRLPCLEQCNCTLRNLAPTSNQLKLKGSTSIPIMPLNALNISANNDAETTSSMG